MPGKIAFNLQKMHPVPAKPRQLNNLCRLLTDNARTDYCDVDFCNGDMEINGIQHPSFRTSTRAISGSGLIQLSFDHDISSGTLYKILRYCCTRKISRAIDYGVKNGLTADLTHENTSFPLTWQNLRAAFVDKHIKCAAFEFRALGEIALVGAVAFLVGGITLFWGFHDYFAGFLSHFPNVPVGPDEEGNPLIGLLGIAGGGFGAVLYPLIIAGYNIQQKIKSTLYNHRFFNDMDLAFSRTLPSKKKERFLIIMRSANPQLASLFRYLL